ncbi:hypothetical protein [Gleimia hominis]|uniref:hypothetical protein n=1 Tax=Gleimia hominis TaxID=595468 RepID=UPI00130425A5|nr:hypothetical protein [Gleimia hominis]WIK64007.1 hypothetical protein CJ187_006760 [Gleimia hominis]
MKHFRGITLTGLLIVMLLVLDLPVVVEFPLAVLSLCLAVYWLRAALRVAR